MKSGGPGASPARLLIVCALLSSCRPDPPAHAPQEAAEVKPDIEQVLARHTPELMRIPGVQGTALALCDGAPCIRIFILDDSVRARLPASLDGHTVSAVVTGAFRTTD
jgi:hypothetical protein